MRSQVFEPAKMTVAMMGNYDSPVFTVMTDEIPELLASQGEKSKPVTFH